MYDPRAGGQQGGKDVIGKFDDVGVHPENPILIFERLFDELIANSGDMTAPAPALC